MENTDLIETYKYVYDNFKELKAIKELIKDYIHCENNKLNIENSYSFAEDLIKLIKYIDVEFYNSLINNKEQGNK